MHLPMNPENDPMRADREQGDWCMSEIIPPSASAGVLAESADVLALRLRAQGGVAARLADRLIESRLAHADTARQFNALLADVSALHQSHGYRLAMMIERLMARLAPEGSRRQRLGSALFRGLKGLYRSVHPVSAEPVTSTPSLPASCPVELTGYCPPPFDPGYHRWIAAHEPDAVGLRQQAAQSNALSRQPLISILTPVLNTPTHLLQAAVDSVLAQTYPHWELILADGGSTEPGLTEQLHELASADSRIRVLFLGQNGGISGNTNAALAAAHGEFIALLDHDDLLAPFALFAMASRLDAEPDLDFLYSDRDLICESGLLRYAPFFKPAWSPALAISGNYLTHLNVMRTALVRGVGGWRASTDGAQDWDIFLRVLEQTRRVAHIPQVLYHWRVWGRSMSSGHAVKPYAYQALLRVVSEHLQRTGRTGLVQLRPNGAVQVRRARPLATPVSVIVQARRLDKPLVETVRGLAGGRFSAQLQVLVALAGREWEGEGVRAELQALGVPVLTDSSASRWAANNHAADQATGDFLLFLDADLHCTLPDWLDELLQWGEQPGVGVVGCRILEADERLRHQGLVIGLNGLVNSPYSGRPLTTADWLATDYYRNYSAVDGSCLLVRRELFAELGGFAGGYQYQGGDVDFCLRVRERGAEVFYTPFVEWRSREAGPWPWVASDREQLRERCAGVLAAGDPYLNPNYRRDCLEMICDPIKPTASSEIDHYRPTPTGQSDGWLTPAVPRSLDAWLDDYTPGELLQFRRRQQWDGTICVRSINWLSTGPLPEGVSDWAAGLRGRCGIESHFVHLREPGDLEGMRPADVAIAADLSAARACLQGGGARRCFLLAPTDPHGLTGRAVARWGFHTLAHTPEQAKQAEREGGSPSLLLHPQIDPRLFTAIAGMPRPRPMVLIARPDTDPELLGAGLAGLRRLHSWWGRPGPILTVGAQWTPSDHKPDGLIENLGRLSAAERSALYRSTEVALVLAGPGSALDLLEARASGCAVIATHHAATDWLIADEEDGVLVEPTVHCLAGSVARVVRDASLRARLTGPSSERVRRRHGQAAAEIDRMHGFLCAPHARRADGGLRLAS